MKSKSIVKFFSGFMKRVGFVFFSHTKNEKKERNEEENDISPKRITNEPLTRPQPKMEDPKSCTSDPFPVLPKMEVPAPTLQQQQQQVNCGVAPAGDTVTRARPTVCSANADCDAADAACWTPFQEDCPAFDATDEAWANVMRERADEGTGINAASAAAMQALSNSFDANSLDDCGYIFLETPQQPEVSMSPGLKTFDLKMKMEMDVDDKEDVSKAVVMPLEISPALSQLCQTAAHSHFNTRSLSQCTGCLCDAVKARLSKGKKPTNKQIECLKMYDVHDV